MTGYIGIGGKAKKVNSLYVGIGGKAKKVIKGYVGVGGKAKLWYSAQKLWTWEKHNIDTTTVYVEVVGSTSSATRTSAFYVGSTYSFNSSTGQFTVNQTTQIANSSIGASNAKNKYYITLTNTSGSQTGSTVYKITDATYSSSYRRLTLTLQAIGSESQTQQSMGSLVGTVTNVDVTTYPANGPQDGYWYVLTGIPSFTYSGSYNSGVVEMGDQYYLLLELTGSGTLTLGGVATADVWICGGGGAGGNYSDERHNGGGGGYAASSNNATIQSLTVVIGSGNSTSGSGAGGQSSVSGDISLSADGGINGNAYNSNLPAFPDGGSGGGSGGHTSVKNAEIGLGDGIAKTPFGSSYFSYPYCDGGGGGGYNISSSSQWNGGAGGTNGGNGGTRSSGGTNGGAGGGHYGGAGGAGSYTTSTRNGSNGTGYGAGGGGAGCYQSSAGSAGNGYQGVCFIRIPLQ